jgi:hypothetical protein
MTSTSRYRSRSAQSDVVSFSISYERENMLARGLGFEHLREMLLRIARPLLRQGAHLAYGGNWKGDSRSGENFTYELLKLISDEQEDNSIGGPDSNLNIGRIYNHSAWPYYLDVTPKVEAQWINCCRIVRITQKLAGIAESEAVPDQEARSGGDLAIFNTAVTLSAMRKLMMLGVHLDIPDVPSPEFIPPITARVMLGGKMAGYSGFAPGLFEEALFTLESNKPLFIIGGFGGSAEVLAQAILTASGRPLPFTLDWHKAVSPSVGKLLDLSRQFKPPAGIRTTGEILDDLYKLLERARRDLPGSLNTSLNEQETRELMTTRDMARVVQLVRKGLARRSGSLSLPA